MSLGQMAKAMNMSSASLSQYEVHKTPFPRQWVEIITDVLQLSEQETQELIALRLSDVLAKSDDETSSSCDLFMEQYVRNRHLLSANAVQELHQTLQHLLSVSSIEERDQCLIVVRPLRS